VSGTRATAADSLRALARQLEIPERTLRRVAAEGMVRGERISARRFRTSLREEAYLRTHWPLLRSLRDALRTEPNVRLAVLFGSTATGRATERSDVDVLVALSDPTAARVAELTGRLERRVGRDIHVVRLHEAQSNPVLMAAALRDGRVLVDRDRAWPELKAADYIAELNARRDPAALYRLGVLGPERIRRLQRLRELRRLLVREYATPTAEQVHEAARIVADEFVSFYDAYRCWIAHGFREIPRSR
jgi:predicted nucleotidyltransferase